MGRLGGADQFGTAWMTEHKEVASSGSVVVGTVKWFDAVKGFGFVVSESGGPDILLHANVLRNYGQGSVADNSYVELTVQQTERGLQAVEVLLVKPPVFDDDSAGPNFTQEIDPDTALSPARVKWFDKVKGFGFANVYGDDEDIFLHVEVLRRCGLADLQAGEAVCLRIFDGDRGKMAAEVHAWDFAINNS